MTMVVSEQDGQLWEASRDGDAAAFMELVARHQTAVCAVTLAHTGNPARAEELAQDTFVAAWRGIAKVRQPERIGAWFCAIARNLSRKQLRKREAEELAHPDQLEGSDIGPEDELDARRTRDLVWAALSQLPERYREPLVLYYRKEQSAREVAETLGLSLSTVEQRLSRGRRMLRTEVERALQPALARAPGAEDRLRRRLAALLPLTPAVGPPMATTTVGGLAMNKLLFVVIAAAAILLFAIVQVSSTDRSPETSARRTAAVPASPRARDMEDLRRAHDFLREGPIDSADPWGGGDDPLPDYQLSRHGDQVTVNLDGGPSRTVLFGARAQLEFRLPDADASERRKKAHEQLMELGRWPEPESGYPMRTITGRVIDARGAPVAGAVVIAGPALAFASDPEESYATSENGARTDESGAFSFDLRVRAADHELSQHSSAIALSPHGWSETIALPTRGDVDDIELRLVPRRRLEGRIVRGGEGYPGTVQMHDEERQVRYEARADLQGRFEVQPITIGTYLIEAAAESGHEAPRTRASRTEIVVGDEPVTKIELELPVGGLIAVTLADPVLETGTGFFRLLRGRHPLVKSYELTALIRKPPPSGEPSIEASQIMKMGDAEVLSETVEFADVAPGTYTVCVDLMTAMTPEGRAKYRTEDEEIEFSTETVAFGCQVIELAGDHDIAEVEIHASPA